MSEPIYLAYWRTTKKNLNPYYKSNPKSELEWETEDVPEVHFLYSDKELTDFILCKTGADIQYFEINQIYPKLHTTVQLVK